MFLAYCIRAEGFDPIRFIIFIQEPKPSLATDGLGFDLGACSSGLVANRNFGLRSGFWDAPRSIQENCPWPLGFGMWDLEVASSCLRNRPLLGRTVAPFVGLGPPPGMKFKTGCSSPKCLKKRQQFFRPHPVVPATNCEALDRQVVPQHKLYTQYFRSPPSSQQEPTS